MKIKNVKIAAVIGAGTMGRQIAMNTLLNGREYGYRVFLCDSYASAVKSAAKWAEEYLESRVTKGRITREVKEELLSRLAITSNVDEAVKDADLVIEAVIEKLEVKKDLFSRISRIVEPDTILGTNSSNIVSSKIADCVDHPERLMNIHYFNPALVMKLVEIIRGPHTGNEAIESAKEFAEHTGKAPIIIQKEVPGFVVNRINAAVANEACSLLANGVASIEDIDKACELGLNYPMGPFRLMDLTGIDVNYYVRLDRYADSHDERDKPSPVVVEKFKKGEFGRKTGKGWYDYSEIKK